MRKHYKLISSIVCLFLCVCMVTFGVYAARTGLVHLNSNISFTPTTAKLKIFGGIAGHEGYSSTVVVPEHNYYACNYNATKEEGNYSTSGSTDTFKPWEYGEIAFSEYLETGDKSHPDPISFYLQITNFVEANVNYSLTINNCSDEFEYTFNYYIADNSLPALNDSTASTSAGWWCTKATSASNPVFHGNTTKPSMQPISFTTTTTEGVTEKVADLSSVDTTLKTIMMVISVQVIDEDQSLDGETFNFTVTAINDATNA